MMKKMAGKYNSTAIKHSTKIKTKIPYRNYIANILADSFSQNPPSKNQKINFITKNTERYNQSFT